MARCQNRTPAAINAIRDLDGALDAHAKWLARLHRDLICGNGIGGDVFDADAHRTCLFGRWFHGRNDADWQHWEEDLQQIGERHQVIHDLARSLASERSAHCKVPVEALDAFSEQLAQFKIATRGLQYRIINEVCMIDHLTGVWNRSSMYLRLTEEHERMVRQQQNCFLCMIDVDHFKAVNDNCGHAAGDLVLQAVVDTVKNGLRAYDSIFRYGGEEFLVCLPNTGADDAAAAMDRIRADIAAQPIAVADAAPMTVTASFGLAPLSDSLSLEESVEVADRALFCAKARGRNQVCRWDAR